MQLFLFPFYLCTIVIIRMYALYYVMGFIYTHHSIQRYIDTLLYLRVVLNLYTLLALVLRPVAAIFSITLHTM